MVDFMDIFSDLNTSTGGGFGVLLPAAIFIVLFIGMKLFDNDDALLGAVILTTLVTLIFWRTGISTFGTMLFWIIASMVIGFITFISH